MGNIWCWRSRVHRKIIGFNFFFLFQSYICLFIKQVHFSMELYLIQNFLFVLIVLLSTEDTCKVLWIILRNCHISYCAKNYLLQKKNLQKYFIQKFLFKFQFFIIKTGTFLGMPLNSQISVLIGLLPAEDSCKCY